MSTLLIRGGSVVTASGLTQTDVRIGTDGVVFSSEEADHTINADGLLIFPGLIDCHVHFREPGLEHKATIASESRAARAGGVTCVCEMPNTIPPTVTAAALADKVRRAAETSDCDVFFFFGATETEHLQALRLLWSGDSEEVVRLRHRCAGLKLYLENSTGDQKAAGGVIEEAFALCGELGIPVVAHCEDPEMNAAANAAITDPDVATHSQRRPAESEAHSVAWAIEQAAAHGAHLQIAHLSTAGALEHVRQAKAAGTSITCEVAPHHLLLTTEHYTHLGTLCKMNPPVRSEADVAALWAGIADGTVDCIATDHAPHLLAEKQVQPPLDAPSGVPGVETMLPLLLTAMSQQALSPERILELCFINPNRIYNLGRQLIEPGNQPDIVLVDPTEHWRIQAANLHSQCGWTPYEDAEAVGRVVGTLRACEGYRLLPELQTYIV